VVRYLLSGVVATGRMRDLPLAAPSDTNKRKRGGVA